MNTPATATVLGVEDSTRRWHWPMLVSLVAILRPAMVSVWFNQREPA